MRTIDDSIIYVTYTAWKVSNYGLFSGPYFPAFGLNTERYSVSLHIQSECGKIRTRKNSVFGHFSRSDIQGKVSSNHWQWLYIVFPLYFCVSSVEPNVMYQIPKGNWIEYLKTTNKSRVFKTGKCQLSQKSSLLSVLVKVEFIQSGPRVNFTVSKKFWKKRFIYDEDDFFYSFLGNLIKSCLRWNLRTTLIQICWIRCWYSFSLFWIGNSLFWQVWSENWKLLNLKAVS